MAKYRSSYRCMDCKHEYERITNYLPKKEPACPKCKQAKRVKTKSNINVDKEIKLKSRQVNEKYKCKSCDFLFLVPQKIGRLDNPFCPSCGSQETNFRDTDLPKAISARAQNSIRAVDATAELVMKDYGMTDLNMGSGTRVGDTCAPKLAPHLQSQADGMFSNKVDPAGMMVRDINTGKYVRLDSEKSKAMKNYQSKLMKKVNNGSMASPEVNAILANPGKPKFDVMNKV